MPHYFGFLQDLAVVMVVAGVTTLLFHLIRQPVVLGYILAGVIIGPYTPPFPLIQDETSIRSLAELGICFVMFRMGLHFRIGELLKIGAPAFFAGSLEIAIMMALGFYTGHFFGWSYTDSIFLGATLSISSTTIIVKTLVDLNLLKEKFTRLTFAILVVEDLLAVAIIALLPAIAASSGVPFSDVLLLFLRLILFLACFLTLGLLVVPRLLKYVSRFHDGEMLLITTLGLLFASALLSVKFGYSVALGAFLIGAITAEAREAGQIERLVHPLRDMFSAVFFVAVGMLIQPQLILHYWSAIIVLAVLVVLGKTISCAIGALIGGNELKTSLKVGIGLAQIGEFSFVIAQLGETLGVTSKFLYPLIVSVSATTAFLNPPLLRNSDRLGNKIAALLPQRVVTGLSDYRNWIKKLAEKSASRAEVSSQCLTRIGIHGFAVTGIFLVASSLVGAISEHYRTASDYVGGPDILGWIGAVILSIPSVLIMISNLGKLSGEFTEVNTSNKQSQTTLRGVLFLAPALVSTWIILLTLLLIRDLRLSIFLVCVLILALIVSKKPLFELAALLKQTVSGPRPAEKDENNDPGTLAVKISASQVRNVKVPETSKVAGLLIRELHLRARTGASIIGIERAGDNIVNPGPDDEIFALDTLLLLGTENQLSAAERIIRGEV